MSQYYARWNDGFEVTWRNLTLSEYKSVRTISDRSLFDEPMDVALSVYKLVYITGPDPKFVPAGIPAYIFKQQMLDNPFSGKYEDVVKAVGLARTVVTGDYLLSAKALIASTLNYKPEEIDHWDPNTFFVRLAQTEVARGRTFDPLDPRASKDQPSSSKRSHRNLTPSQQRAIDRTKERDRG